MRSMTGSRPAAKSSGEAPRLLIGPVVLIVALVAALSLWAAQVRGIPGAIGIGILITIAGASIGCLVGFLFSLPRVLTVDATPAVVRLEAGAAKGVGDGGAGKPKPRLLASNTNLERISEWLTTMLVGVGLTQISSLFDYTRRFSNFIGTHAAIFTGIDGKPTAGVLPIVAPILLVFGLVVGFLSLYLYTRLALSPLFLMVEDTLTRDPGKEVIQGADHSIREEAATIADATQDPVMRQVADGRAISVEESLYVIQNLLYEDEAFDRAIQLGNQLAGTSAPQIAHYWLLMAAAFGQRHHFLLQSSGPAAKDTLAARRSALDSVKEAVKRDPRLKAQLRAMMNADAVDNDLQDFKDDPEFLAVL
jgi:hypothetical protein